MLSPDQFRQMRPEIDAYSQRSIAHDDDHVSSHFYKSHDAGHAANPLYQRLGWGNSHQCMYPGCDHENKELSDWDSPVNSAEPGHGRWTEHTVDPRALKLVHQESVVDTSHLDRLISGNQIHRKSHPPLLVPFQGAMHIRDGGHRMAAAAIRNEPLNVRVYRGE